MDEFEIIRRFFTRSAPSAILGVGDDAALLRIGHGMELAVSADMLASGTHFLPDTDPFFLGHKALAVNLSDMAAVGAQPRWALLALALPQADETWLQKFSDGFFALAQRYNVELVGGDTTRGPLNMCVTIMGEVPQGMALLRSGAQAGDDVWISGRVGDAALALAHLQGKIQMPAADFSGCAEALHRPVPRVALGMALRGVAHSAIDVSDGLLADLGHIMECSRVGAKIQFDALPVSNVSRSLLGSQSSTEKILARHCVLAGGDDYELCFTASVDRRAEVMEISARIDVPLARIGTMIAGSGCTVYAADGSIINIEEPGYDHFR